MFTKENWEATYHEPGNDVQNGLAGYSIQGGGEGIAYNIARESNARLIAAGPELVKALRAARISMLGDEHYQEFKPAVKTIDEALALVEVK